MNERECMYHTGRARKGAVGTSAEDPIVQEALRKHMHRKLLGFVLRPLYAIQDFIKVACGADAAEEYQERRNGGWRP